MATLDVYNTSGDVTGSVDIDTDQLAPKINKQLLHDVVLMYQANGRQGSAATKSRSEVAGSRRKMYRQKGTGNARAGHRTSGVRRGGGHIFAKNNVTFITAYQQKLYALQLAWQSPQKFKMVKS
jgi:large subunit ribosomal protein L4